MALKPISEGRSAEGRRAEWRLAELRPPGLTYLVQPARRLAGSALALLEGLQHGTVLAIGLGFNHETPSPVRAGDRVFYEPMTGRRILLDQDDLLILAQDDILLVEKGKARDAASPSGADG